MSTYVLDYSGQQVNAKLGTSITANPTLLGNETSLTAIEINGTKYSIDGSGSVSHDLPSGGTSGQVLIKSSATNYDVEWGAVSGLPTVSTSDNGKVLRVVSGAWAVVSLPSASGVSF